MAREIIIDHSEIRDPNTITQVQERKFKEAGLDMHRHEVTAMDDDHKGGKRRLRIKNVQYFDMGRGRG